MSIVSNLRQAITALTMLSDDFVQFTLLIKYIDTLRHVLQHSISMQFLFSFCLVMCLLPDLFLKVERHRPSCQAAKSMLGIF